MSTDVNAQLLKAVFQEDMSLVKDYIQQDADVNYISSEQDNALLIAIDTMNIELINFLLAHGANPNPDPAQVYALPLNLAVDVAVQAVLNEEADTISNEAVELLLRHGADFTVRDQSGKNALEMATNYNSAARQLLEARLNS
jgi:ankyrin repeat protein